MSFFIYDANYFIIFFKKKYFINGLKTCRLYTYVYVCMYVCIYELCTYIYNKFTSVVYVCL